MREFRLKAYETLHQQADADVGRHRTAQPDRFRRHPLFREVDRQDRTLVGRRPRRHQAHLRPLGYPRGRAQVSWPAFPRSTNPKSSITTSARSSRRRASSSATWIPRFKRVSRDRAEVSRDGHSGRRQQILRAQLGGVVGRVVRLRAAGRRSQDAAPSLLPYQRREHGAIRAHADHRRQGFEGPLHRGLHRAEVLDFVAAQRRRRTDRDGRRLDPLYDDPELVSQHLQSRHQARDRAEERDRRMGRRQHRLQAHDEVSGDLPDGRRCARRDSFDGVRRRRPASGCRRESHSCRAEHDVGRDEQERERAWRQNDLPRPGRDFPRRDRREDARTCDA